MGGILFVHGGEKFARERFDQGRPCWSHGLPLVLEKHGFVAVNSCGPQVLYDQEVLASHDIVLLASLTPGTVTGEVISRLEALGRPVLAGVPSSEGWPLPGVQQQGVLELPRTLAGVSAELVEHASRYGAAAEVRLGTPRLEQQAERISSHWSEVLSVPIDSRRATAWAAVDHVAQRWTVSDGVETLAEFVEDGPSAIRHPGIVRRGHFTACAFDLFGHLVRAHSAPPAPPGQVWRHENTIELEFMLLGLIDGMYRQSGAPRLRMRPWPSGTTWVRNIRHDFVRPLTLDRIRQTLNAHRRAGSAATWHWRAKPRHQARRPPLEPRELAGAAVVAEQRRHEVALHAELLWTGAAGERETLEAATGRQARGASVYTGRGESFRWQGAPNVLWAQRQGLDYTELLGQTHFHPHRFPVLAPDGTLEVLRVICLPHHVPFRLQKGVAAGSDIDALLPLWMGVGGFLQIANQPDVDQTELFEYLSTMPADGRADWTAAEVADWWRRTHTDQLQVTSGGRGAFVLTASAEVQDLVLELLAPDGTDRIEVVSLSPGVPTTVFGHR